MDRELPDAVAGRMDTGVHVVVITSPDKALIVKSSQHDAGPVPCAKERHYNTAKRACCLPWQPQHYRPFCFTDGVGVGLEVVGMTFCSYQIAISNPLDWTFEPWRGSVI